MEDFATCLVTLPTCQLASSISNQKYLQNFPSIPWGLITLTWELLLSMDWGSFPEINTLEVSSLIAVFIRWTLVFSEKTNKCSTEIIINSIICSSVFTNILFIYIQVLLKVCSFFKVFLSHGFLCIQMIWHFEIRNKWNKSLVSSSGIWIHQIKKQREKWVCWQM